MPRVQWPLSHGRPCVQVVLTLTQSGRLLPRTLLADTGAGSRRGKFQLILTEHDCLLCGGIPLPAVAIRGAFAGSFRVYGLPVRIPALGFDQKLRAVGAPSLPGKLDGIACFGFLNRFTYGNFGDPDQFGLES